MSEIRFSKLSAKPLLEAYNECIDLFDRFALNGEQAAAVVAMLMLAVENMGLQPESWPILREMMRVQTKQLETTSDGTEPH